VFTSPIGTPIDPRNDFREFRKLLARAGLLPVRLHDLRHTAASLLLAKNVPARVVMEILDHSQIALTMNCRMARVWHETRDRLVGEAICCGNLPPELGFPKRPDQDSNLRPTAWEVVCGSTSTCLDLGR
jgi:hypothetical protein